MAVEEAVHDVSVKITMPDELAERWDRFIYDRGYSRGPFLRSFIEAVTDPARGPQIERIIQNRKPAKEMAARRPGEAEECLNGEKAAKAPKRASGKPAA
jgi:hypothetical protein